VKLLNPRPTHLLPVAGFSESNEVILHHATFIVKECGRRRHKPVRIIGKVVELRGKL
jgi:hypothetical protein